MADDGMMAWYMHDDDDYIDTVVRIAWIRLRKDTDMILDMDTLYRFT